jgi:hypothetical protein
MRSIGLPQLVTIVVAAMVIWWFYGRQPNDWF